MFYSLSGQLVHADSNSIAIDCHGVAYACQVTLTTLNQLGSVGSNVKVFTYLSVRDNAMDLFGFSSQSELTCFKMLITVTGIGPKMAIGILSHLTPEKIALCIAADDYKTLTQAPGVGNKTAQRIVLELKDKIKNTDVAQGVRTGGEISIGTGNISEALGALVVLGYNQSQAAAALQGASPEDATQDLIKQALRKLAEK